MEQVGGRGRTESSAPTNGTPHPYGQDVEDAVPYGRDVEDAVPYGRDVEDAVPYGRDVEGGVPCGMGFHACGRGERIPTPVTSVTGSE